MKLNGWNRLGIVFTVIYWLVLSLVVFDANTQLGRVTERQDRAYTYFVRYVPTTDAEHAEFNFKRETSFSDCMNNPLLDMKELCGAGYLHEPNYIAKPVIASYLIFYILIPLLVWLGIYLTLFVFRWVRAGFKSDT
jgi:hypothetical protein